MQVLIVEGEKEIKAIIPQMQLTDEDMKKCQDV